MAGGIRVRPGGGDFADRGIVILVLDRAKIDAFNQPGGMTNRYITKIAERVKERARNKLYPGHGYVTGELRRSVRSSVTPGRTNVVGSVRATSAHALLYHNGRGSTITSPNDPDGRLAFFWKKEGRKFVGRPGQSTYAPAFRGRPFLRDAQREVLREHGLL